MTFPSPPRPFFFFSPDFFPDFPDLWQLAVLWWHLESFVICAQPLISARRTFRIKFEDYITAVGPRQPAEGSRTVRGPGTTPRHTLRGWHVRLQCNTTGDASSQRGQKRLGGAGRGGAIMIAGLPGKLKPQPEARLRCRADCPRLSIGCPALYLLVDSQDISSIGKKSSRLKRNFSVLSVQYKNHCEKNS